MRHPDIVLPGRAMGDAKPNCGVLGFWGCSSGNGKDRQDPLLERELHASGHLTHEIKRPLELRTQQF